MSANHHDLIFQLRIGSRNLCNGIESVLVIASELRLDCPLEGDRNMVFQEPPQPVVVLDHHYRIWNRDRIRLYLRIPDDVRAVVVKDNSRATTIAAITAWRNNCCDMLLRHHLHGSRA